jgi:Leu/Phe-tRNA-protein transferase
MSDEDKLYKEAMDRINELVEDVMQTCEEVADENDYERTWVLERFREQFNKVKRTNER